MPVVSLREILERAFHERYGVAAFNVVDELTLGAVIAAATEVRSPVIVQTSLKTVKAIGPEALVAMFRAAAGAATVPVTLHLDHCPDREWVSKCLRAGWNSVLFDGSHLDIAENTVQTSEVVAEAHALGADVEGEVESVQGVEDGLGSEEPAEIYAIDACARFVEETGVDCFAPAIGTAHGLYTAAPRLMPERVTQLVDRVGLPMVLHGGTGLGAEQFSDLIARGCAKVNISTALKIAFLGAHREYLQANPNVKEPLDLLGHVREAVKAMAIEHLLLFGSAGRAWDVAAGVG